MLKSRSLALRPVRGGVLPSVDSVVARERPSEPVLCLRPAAIAAAAQAFIQVFPGDVLYAVKCNPEPRVLRAVWAGGVRHFDCASLPEVALIRRVLPEAEVHFMHPVKARHAIHAAYHEHGVGDFAFDSADELQKILQETVPVGLVGEPPVLGLFVRLAVGQGGAYDLSGKFGVSAVETAELLRLARPHAARLGIGFHVGSQCLASTRPPMRGRWRSPPTPSSSRRCQSRSSMSAADFRSAIRMSCRRRSRLMSLRLPMPLPALATGSGYGPSPAARWSPAAARSWCRSSCAAVMCFT